MIEAKEVNEYCQTYGINHNAGKQDFPKQQIAQGSRKNDQHYLRNTLTTGAGRIPGKCEELSAVRKKLQGIRLREISKCQIVFRYVGWNSRVTEMNK